MPVAIATIATAVSAALRVVAAAHAAALSLCGSPTMSPAAETESLLGYEDPASSRLA